MEQHERIARSAILTQADLAHLVGLAPRTVKSWCMRRNARPPLITQARKGYGATPPTIPLLGLSEAAAMKQLQRDHGIGPRRLAAVVTAAKDRDPLAFAREGFFTDGTDIFWQNLDGLERIRDKQQALREAFGEFLKHVSFDSDGVMESYVVTGERGSGPHTMIDPRYSAGRPILGLSGAPVFAVLDAIESGENWTVIAEDYGVDMDEVRHVADHRERLAHVA